MIDLESDDENDNVSWVDIPINIIDTFNCGCCDDCTCDDEIICTNCYCGCKISQSEDEEEIQYNINDFTIDIIEDKTKERKVCVNVNITLNGKNISIKLDINRALYLQIAEELFDK